MSETAHLKCNELWKVYGENSEQRFKELKATCDDNADLAQKLRDEGQIVAVGGVSFEIPVGEIFIIMGLSGSGKSTIVRCLSRLVDATAGEVLLDGEDLLAMSPKRLIEARRKKMGMVFQHFGLMPHLTVLENVGLPLRMQGQDRAAWAERAQTMIDLVGLDGREDSYPNELSGGQQQRVGIARSLAVDPELWFLDEPFSALDPLIRRQMQDEFLKLQKQLGKTIVFITHDFLEAVKLGDRIAIMHEGKLDQLGTPADLVLRPANEYVANFTEEVPLTKIICAGDIMEDGSSPDTAPSVLATDTLDIAIEAFSDGEDSIVVKDESGDTKGIITSRQIINALRRG